MNKEAKIRGLGGLGSFLKEFLTKNNNEYTPLEEEFQGLLLRSEIENPWFTQDSLRYALESLAEVLNEAAIGSWTEKYPFSGTSKRVGLILAGNLPLVGFHDVMCVVLSGHIPVIKLSSKDRLLIPFLMKIWNNSTEGGIEYEFVEKLENFDAVIATGSNNTARYLEFYFKDYLNIIRKNRTSVAVLNGDETDEELQLLAEDIFRYFGLGCRNVTRLFIPEDFKLERLFENFLNFKDVINHNKYANNYDYNRAVYLLNQEPFWDNNFVMLREGEELFSPLSVINFSRYKNLDDVKTFISEHQEEIQCIVAKDTLGLASVSFGEAQKPGLDVYADNVDTMAFLSVV
ncbi:acyl-CoA reductase [Elizabethkingia miricola]|uniref:Acyl-CoA reductase n=1 Tax=Elizabethkingia miricola TaxID=172045 RepID=A0ABD5BAJ5_ELIMR|nr:MULTISPECIES: acyl-CoA reductase [Elizabethkingia]MDQ8750705.1 acyl-CoA reductase [Elizabethkingia miricola]NHQ66723.1 acyl-CoA reductase [Elizabethkingia miricola]NHQ71454.1 acyl-CoA reductase [Elizabethkingia miricola]NHQ77096.1 acyl-CoA reductase [Elizabethkingia miricola]OPB90913.1 acyl-CoA reductase [Elizabethkingia miricola]